MPQMAPLWWEMLYIMLTLMLLMTSIIIYHMKPVALKKNKAMRLFSTCNWKW
uniref:ATP synthase F0 subunit 8 n=1 Tax=Antilochus russus TaxID=1768094 RepID=A0A4Y1JW06_9HEMI|nr:ATP synthase F0 subunit 8 [Antilochus russus]APO08952.1 ATP synthase F0 subunit 8 [Antilochus russus]